MIKQVIVIRKDLNMRKGKMIAQGAHASLKVFLDRKQMVGRDCVISLTDQMHEWINGIFTKICVSVDSEVELLDIYNRAKEDNLPVALIQDCGLTEFGNVPTYTCLAIGPDEIEKIDKITGGLKLL